MQQRAGNARPRQRAGGAGPAGARVRVGLENVRNPIQLLGVDRLGFWLAREDWSAASWASRAGGLQVDQTSPTQRGVTGSGIGTGPTVVLDGSDDAMVGQLSTPLAIGSRPLLLAVARLVSVQVGGTPMVLMLGVGDSTTIESALYLFTTGSPGTQSFAGGQSASSAPNVRSWYGPPGDTRPHIFELAWSAGSTGRFLIDGLARDNVNTTGGDGSLPPQTAIDTLVIGAQASAAGSFTNCNVELSDIVCVRDVTAMSAEERIALRIWAASRIVNLER